MITENGVITFILGMLIAYLFLVPSKDTIQEKSVYLKYCADSDYNIFSCPSHTKLLKREYKILIDQQMIVDKFGYSYKSCVVYDKDNWECDKGQREGQTYRVSMRDGNFYETNDGTIDEDGQKSSISFFFHIGMAEYYVSSTIGFFRSFFP
jgi:hypothetical protein